MINVHWVILGAVIGFSGLVVYIGDTLRGITTPNRMSWLLWGVAPMLAFAVELHEGVGLESLMTFTVGFGPLLVFAASFIDPKAVWRIGTLEYVCGALSVAGTVAWLVTRQGTVAIAAAIAADALAALPNLVKSWRFPETETVWGYAGGFVNAVITLLAATSFTAAMVAFPLYIALVTALELSFVGGRLGPRLRHALGRPEPAPDQLTATGSGAGE